MLRRLVNGLVSAAFALAAVSEGPVHVTAEARVEDPRRDGWHGDGKMVLFANLFVPVRSHRPMLSVGGRIGDLPISALQVTVTDATEVPAGIISGILAQVRSKDPRRYAILTKGGE